MLRGSDPTKATGVPGKRKVLVGFFSGGGRRERVSQGRLKGRVVAGEFENRGGEKQHPGGGLSKSFIFGRACTSRGRRTVDGGADQNGRAETAFVGKKKRRRHSQLHARERHVGGTDKKKEFSLQNQNSEGDRDRGSKIYPDGRDEKREGESAAKGAR